MSNDTPVNIEIQNAVYLRKNRKLKVCKTFSVCWQSPQYRPSRKGHFGASKLFFAPEPRCHPGQKELWLGEGGWGVGRQVWRGAPQGATPSCSRPASAGQSSESRCLAVKVKQVQGEAWTSSESRLCYFLAVSLVSPFCRTLVSSSCLCHKVPPDDLTITPTVFNIWNSNGKREFPWS